MNSVLLCLIPLCKGQIPALDYADYYFDKTWIAVGPKQSEG